jgi:hypothetical protein
VGFLDRFRRPQYVWFATLTGPLYATRCVACGEERTGKEMQPAEFYSCSGCKHTLAFYPALGQGTVRPAETSYLRHGKPLPFGKSVTPLRADGSKDYDRAAFKNTKLADRDPEGKPLYHYAGPWRCLSCLYDTHDAAWRDRHTTAEYEQYEQERRIAAASYAKGRPDVRGRCTKCREFCHYCLRAFPVPELAGGTISEFLPASVSFPAKTFHHLICADCRAGLDEAAAKERNYEAYKARRERERRGPTLGTGDNGQPVTLAPDVRNRHTYVIGKTGSGKSSLLRNLIMQDMETGHGLIYLDPHGDTAQTLLGYVPDDRLDDVIYFCPTDTDCPAFNLLATDYAPDKLTRDMVSAIKMFFGDSWGPRLNQLLTNALATLLLDRVNEPHTLADLERLLIEEDYRDTIARRSPHPKLTAFWLQQFPTMAKDATHPVLNKLSDLLMPLSPMERIFSATGNSLDLSAIMNDRKILLVNLSKGELGEAGAFLIGGLIVTAVAQAALARVKIPEGDRVDCFLYVDEFQNFTIDSFQSILSEARKYRLNLTLAHQYLHQVPADLQAAIFGNVATIVCLPISADDAGTMQREMTTPHEPPSLLDEVLNVLNTPAKQHPGWTAPQGRPEWPTRQDFLTLPPLTGLVKINTPENVQRFAISHPTAKPNPDTRAAVLAAQAARMAENAALEKNRPLKMPQEPRSAAETTQDQHQNPTTFDDNPADTVHSPDDETPTHQPPPRRLPTPRRRP